MVVATSAALLLTLRSRLHEREFHVEASSCGIWASRQSRRAHVPFGWRTTDYCVTTILDEQTRTVRLWDAVLDKHAGILAHLTAPLKLAAVAGVRTELEKVVQAAGWTLVYGFTTGSPPLPRVFKS